MSEPEAVILARMDERLKRIESLCADYVTRREVQPIRYIVYGGAGTIMAGFLGAVIKIVGFK